MIRAESAVQERQQTQGGNVDKVKKRKAVGRTDPATDEFRNTVELMKW